MLVRFLQTIRVAINYMAIYRIMSSITKKDAKGDNRLPSSADVSNASSLTKTEIEQANSKLRFEKAKSQTGKK